MRHQIISFFFFNKKSPIMLTSQRAYNISSLFSPECVVFWCDQVLIFQFTIGRWKGREQDQCGSALQCSPGVFVDVNIYADLRSVIRPPSRDQWSKKLAPDQAKRYVVYLQCLSVWGHQEGERVRPYYKLFHVCLAQVELYLWPLQSSISSTNPRQSNHEW